MCDTQETYKYETQEGSRGHEWKREENGDIDIFGVDSGYHNGPICVKCGYGFCHHCQRGPDEDCTA